MKKSVLIFLCLALAALPSFAAAVADFKGNCAPGIPTNCVFDATLGASGPSRCTGTPTPTITQYFWNFNINITTDDLWTTSSYVSYTYPGAYCDWVRLTVFCSDGTSDTRTIGLCNTFGAGGWIYPGGGWLP